ncbi:hypothetical protein BJX68DRAFT_182243 [Aspergillus pseudodeflectus]|uniref:Uncharacterized protein n=1 Tax=Aspergillus pseudodeflectus TaxID=176178 RepID=A0ABR4JLK7_9EURO
MAETLLGHPPPLILFHPIGPPIIFGGAKLTQNPGKVVICDHVWLIRPGQGIDTYAAKGSDRLIVAGISELGDLHDGGDSPIKGALSESHDMVELVVVVEVGCAIICRCAIVRCCSGKDFLGVEVVQAKTGNDLTRNRSKSSVSFNRSTKEYRCESTANP